AAGSVSVPYIARLNSGTGAWEAVPGGSLDGPVRALAAVSTDLYVGGDFQNLGTDTHFKRVAKFATNTSTWTPLNSGLDGPAYALAPGASSSVYVGGSFVKEAGAPLTVLNGIGRWNSNGTWSNLANGMNGVAGVQGGAVRALAFDGISILYAGGDFTMASNVP